MSTTDGPCANTTEADAVNCVTAQIEITSGPTAGETAPLEQSVVSGNKRFEKGDELVLGYVEDDKLGSQYYFSDYQRRAPLAAASLLVGLTPRPLYLTRRP